jgi:parallel beta-helix repeat protein
VIGELGGGNYTWAEAVTQLWCSGNGTWANPYIIENITMDVGGTGSGIVINNSRSVHFLIKGCTVFNAGTGTYQAGIKLENTSNVLLTNNNCSNNDENGILLYNFCDNNTIVGNIACNFGTTNQDIGISLRSDCNNNTISNNILNNNTFSGIHVYGWCFNNTVSGNTANYNGGGGIWFDETCGDNTILSNTANDNTEYGLYFDIVCIGNKIIGNDIYNNGLFGITLSDRCNNTLILRNFIYFNTNGAIDARDSTCYNNILKRNVMVSEDEKYVLDTAINTTYISNYYLTAIPILFIDFIPQSSSTTEFLVNVNVSSQCLGLEVSVSSIQVWWNGLAVHSSNIIEINPGLFQISLIPVMSTSLVPLNMTITEPHHQVKFYEINLLGSQKIGDLELLLIATLSILCIILALGVALLLKSRNALKKKHELLKTQQKIK